MGRTTSKVPELSTEGAAPLYAGVKQMILGKIRSGEWPPRHRIPSESALVEELGVSRMTVNRALRELSIEGVLLRVQGLGSFVADGKLQTSVFEVRNIADEIAERGNKYSATIVLLDELKASPEVADTLDRPIGSIIFHSIIVHNENDIPIQLEERYVNPELVPEYMAQDFAQITPNQYLTQIAPWTEAEHRVEAILPASWETRLLGITRADPCLLIRRRTWMGDRIASAVRLLFPGGRYRIESKQFAHSS